MQVGLARKGRSGGYRVARGAVVLPEVARAHGLPGVPPAEVSS